MRRSIPIYFAALLLGVAAMLLVLPLPTLVGGGPGWAVPIPDQAQALSGHLAFQADVWRWPPLFTERLFWPRGLPIVLTDSNPLFSLLAKIWTRSTGAAPSNWLCVFVAACWVAQPVAAAYAARGLGVSGPGALAAGVLACAWPALLHRSEHLNLCLHAVLLVALGLAFRRIARPGPWWPGAVLLLVAVLTQPYLFQLAAAVLAAVPIHATLQRRPGWKREWATFLGSGVLAVAVLRVLGGPLGGGDRGFVFFSMNLLSPFWPQRSGVFGAALPIIDATGGQYEGLNWLGAGTWLLLGAALVHFAWRRRWPRIPAALLLVLGGLALLSLSSRVYAGHHKLLDLGTKPWEDLFGTFRASGRAFWPTGYALMLGAVAAADRMRRVVALPLLGAALMLQVVDAVPLRDEARAWWVNGYGAVVPAVPAGTALFGLAPHPGCEPDPKMKMGGPIMGLQAVRGGARLRDIGLGRSPEWFSCEAVIADLTELPLLPHETRVFFPPGLPGPVDTTLLGPGAVCRGQMGFVVCARDAPPLPGTEVAVGPAPALLGMGWLTAADGAVWSEGPYSTLRLPATVRRVRLRLSGVAAAAGGVRQEEVAVGSTAERRVDLPDGGETELLLDLPGDGPGRIAFRTRRPVDPTRRKLAAPVHRAAMRLLGLAAEDAAGQPIDGLFAPGTAKAP